MKYAFFVAIISVFVVSAHAADYTVDASHSWAGAVSAARASSGTPPFVIDINRDITDGGDSRINKSVIINGNNHTFIGTIDFTAGNAATAVVKDLTLTGGTTGWGVIADTRNGPSPMQSLTLENVKIIDNTRGGLWTFITGGGNIFINGGEMSRNTNANYAGGAIYNTNGANITISGTSFKNNHAGATDSYNGGAIWAGRNGIITIKDGATFTGNHALNGGAITFQGTVNISDSTFSDNYATSNGGAIYMNGSNAAALLSITNGTFTGNRTTGAQSSGGAIKMDAGTVNVIGGLFNENETGMFGGAIYMIGGSITGGATFGDKDAKTGNSSGMSGGAVYNTDADLTFDSVKMYYNSAGRNGGAISTQYSNLTITGNSEFIGNNADTGGAIFNNSGGVLTINGATFNENHSVNSGGAIQGFDLSVTNSTFTGNYSENGSGGAISNIIALVDNVEFTDNHADKGMGGAIFVSYTPSYSTAQRIQNSVFTGNSALLGGAIMGYTPHELIIGGNTKFIGNTAITAAGTESGEGGAIFNIALLTLDTTLGDITFTGNTADKGADIFNNEDPDSPPVINIIGDTGKLSMDGGIAGIGEINKTGANWLVLEDGNDSTGFTGTYRQSAGRTLVYSDKFFGGENYITNGSSLNILNNNTRIENLHLETEGYLGLRETLTETGDEYKPNKVSIGTIVSDGTGIVMIETDGATSDWLEITDGASGTFGLYVDAIGNNPTVDKIRVVNFTQIGIDNATFKLDPRGGIFKVGAFEYDLVMEEDGGHKNWYLEMNTELNASAQTAMGIPALHLSIVKAGMNELRKRMGALRNNNNNDSLVGAWVRGYGKNLSIKDVSKTDMNLWGIEAGFDMFANALNGKVYFGLMGGYMSSEDIKITTKYDVKADGWSRAPSVGAYLTWVHKSGSSNKWFLDLTARHFWVHNNVHRTDYTNGYDVRRSFWAFSGEVGKLFYGRAPEWLNVGTIGDSHISFEPKIELRYGVGQSEDFKTDNGMSGQVEQTNAFSTRFMVQTNFLPNGVKSIWKPFVELGVYNEWLGNTDMTYAGTKLSPSNTKGMGFEASLGANATISDSTYLYGAFTGEFGEIYTSYQLSLGIRSKF